MTTTLEGSTICVTGGAGFLGRAVCERLRREGIERLAIPRSREYDLTDRDAVRRWFDRTTPDIVIHLAAEVGGIGANQRHPGRFFYANMAMGLNLIEESRLRGVRKFVQVGSVCAYPKHCPVPFRENDLWNGYPEDTNAAYGITKRSLGVMLEAYHREYGLNGVFLLPVNLYGPGDNFHPEDSHVIPALIRKFVSAVDTGREEVTCWGSGRVTREFLYVDDAAEAIVRATRVVNDPDPMNLGSGEEISIHDLAQRIARLAGFHGRINWDSSRPDGQPRRRLDTSRSLATLGWRHRTGLEEGLQLTLNWWRSTRGNSTPSD
jgi:GDP-L-fucose synthase